MEEKEITRRLTDLKLLVLLQKYTASHTLHHHPGTKCKEHVEESSLLSCKKLPATNMEGSDKPRVRSRKRDIIAGAVLTGKANLKDLVAESGLMLS